MIKRADVQYLRPYCNRVGGAGSSAGEFDLPHYSGDDAPSRGSSPPIMASRRRNRPQTDPHAPARLQFALTGDAGTYVASVASGSTTASAEDLALAARLVDYLGVAGHIDVSDTSDASAAEDGEADNAAASPGHGLRRTETRREVRIVSGEPDGAGSDSSSSAAVDVDEPDHVQNGAGAGQEPG